MSSALWCDKGDHAFSAKDPNKQHFSNTHTVSIPTGNSYGRVTYQERQEVTEELDICGPCWAKTNPFSPDGKAAHELVADTQNEDYLRGYREGILKGEDSE